MIPVALVDYDCGLEQALLHDLAEMLTVVSQRDFAREAPYGYGLGAQCRVATSLADVAPGEWPMGFWSHPDVPGALGYHDVGPHGSPIMHCFPFLGDPGDRGITESHELFEALADADCTTAVVGADGVIRAREPGDPVEATSYEYTCASGRVLRVSNWVTPAFFSPPPMGGVPYDFLGLVKQPGDVLPGGYQIYFDPRTKQWVQNVNGSKRPYRVQLEALGVTRFARRQTVPRVPMGGEVPR